MKLQLKKYDDKNKWRILILEKGDLNKEYGVIKAFINRLIWNARK